MNWKTFLALLARDAHVARRNVVPLLLQTFLQPMMFVFIFGRVMVRFRLFASDLYIKDPQGQSVLKKES